MVMDGRTACAMDFGVHMGALPLAPFQKGLVMASATALCEPMILSLADLTSAQPRSNCEDKVTPRVKTSENTSVSLPTLLKTQCAQVPLGLLSSKLAPAPGLSAPTTLMFRNLPNDYSRDNMVEMLDAEGFAALYDFLYLPMDFTSGMCLGYAFVNFVHNLDAVRARETFSGFQRWKVSCGKVCEVQWSQRQQGLQEHIDHFRNNPLMHPDIPDVLKPLLFNDGKCVEFPAPTERLAAPDRLIKRCKKLCRKARKSRDVV